MPFVTVGADNIHYDRGGSEEGPALVLVHGSGGDHSHWPSELRDLGEARVFAPDLPGHGRSEGRGRKSVEDYADFIDAFVSELGLGDVVPVGHSLGGAVVQILALRSPAWLSRIILVGTGARLRVHPDILKGLQTAPEGTLRTICDWSFGPDAPRSAVTAAYQNFLKTDPAVIHGDYSACDRFDIMDRVGEIPHPALVVVGTADRMTPAKYGKHLHRGLSRSRLAVIENGGHMMGLEKPEALVRCISDFLNSGDT